MKIVKNAAEYDQILRDNGSVFVDFYADWCGPCRMVSPLVEQLAGANPDVTFIKVNVDDNPDIAQRYGIMSIPTLLAVKNGTVVNQSVGYQGMGALQGLIDSAK